MTKMRKVKRSAATAVLMWIGRRMIHRVQKRTLRTVTEKPKAPRRRLFGKSVPAATVPARKRCPLRRKPTPPPPVKASSRARRRTGQGIAFAVLSAAAIAALKVGVGHLVEAEREQQVVTPDFDVFSDDDE